ncbi:hypothetical protein BOX15_Mlig032745g1 [Macrostomum lignano]|uniref:Uncharacterized protein n=2 Tax=Macrostomum lignano TaxID=282301 RepID=A0A267EXR2_9PLAT|nr:hypothetical protein BOX15_Mlig032745g1 [Macrostomum lignano]
MAAQVQPAAPSDKRLANHLRVRKTEARPGRTLFGSVLERIPDSELQAAQPQLDAALAVSEDVAWKPVAMRRERPQPEPLPAELADYLRQQHAPDIQRHSRELDEHRKRLQVRERRINLMERDAKYVFDLPHPLDSLPTTRRNYGARPRWMTAGDLAHSAEVNPDFMAPGVRNFNRDKYRRLPEAHSYALVGDPLRKGMEFDNGGPPPPLPGCVRPDRPVLNSRTKQRQQTMRRLPPSSQLVNGIDVPMRLMHQFGTEVCHNLLSSREAVLDTSRKLQQKKKFRQEPAGEADQQSAAAQLETGDPTYEQLGNALRTNVFGRGHSVNQRVSSNHLDYTQAQFEQREPIPDAYRYKKDHVSRWAEANVLEMRMKKALQDRMDRMLHKKADD